jgi:hypothetical protein
MRTKLQVVRVAAIGVLAASLAFGQEYEFKGGFPTRDTVLRVWDETNFRRAVEAYRFFYPTVSAEATFQGQRDAGCEDNKAAMLMACAPKHLLFTGNSDTPYLGVTIDLKPSGPVVLEIPPGKFLGIVNDHNFRWTADVGLPGPDAGKGGKHLILPPDFKGEAPQGYFVSRAATYKVLFALRVLPPGGDLKAGLDQLRKTKIYPLAKADNPPAYAFEDFTDRKVDLTPLRWEDNFQFWQKLNEVIQEEPAFPEFRPMYGLLAALGIEKGKPFQPTPRIMAILTRSAKEGRDQMLVSGFASPRRDRFVWNDRKWEWSALCSENGDFELPTGVDIEARDRWFSQAVGVSPKMFLRKPGAGSLYWLSLRDKDGAFLDGSKTYKLGVPQPVPAKLFWSVTVYDAATRSQIQTSQDKAALRSLFELKDKSTPAADLYFGPGAPAGHEGEWIKTNPGKGWFAYFRIYGPEGPAFDGTWKPADFEPVQESELQPTGRLSSNENK